MQVSVGKQEKNHRPRVASVTTPRRVGAVASQTMPNRAVKVVEGVEITILTKSVWWQWV